ncbi:geraniol 8-hydroxylase-like [Solanum verrucosum]|uniref:geraniol 8-hydroxylase-like n=1 Tax=Solanum verrucosum TaxID=315347 RepID=UPI0020D0F8C0|nr:geraniol 8-hydroxylase-like [Solanum verrucosum]
MNYFILVLASIFALIFVYSLAKLSSKKLPPGPSPWPIIGNIHLLGANPHTSLANLAKIYGPIMSLKIGQITTIVISSSSMAKQVLKNHDLAFSTRFIPDALQAHNYSKFSAVWLPVCPQWRTLRKIMNTKLLSTNRLDANQHLRSQKEKELIDYCEKCSQQGEAVDVGQLVFKTNLNLVSNTLFSKDLVDLYSDAKVELKDAILSIIDVAGMINLVDFFPILENVDPQRIRYRTNIHFGKLYKLFGDMINERLEEKKTNQSEKSDILQVLLNHSAENPQEMDRNFMNSMLLDLFIGSIDTITNTVEWAMAEILRQPEIMKKVQAELAQVVGKGKPIEEADVSRLPYLQFIIKETLRLHPPAPFLIPRRVDQDVELCDYIIPKGSIVLVNAWAIGRDSSFWEDTLVFKPERFQSLELNMRGKDFELIPFGAGRRTCPGFPLALRLMPVILGSMLNSFNWKLEACIEPKDLDMEEKFGAIIAKAHPLRAIPSPL